MVNVYYEIRTPVAASYQQMAERIQPEFARAVNETLIPALEDWLSQRLGTMPGPSVHPFVWSHDPAANMRAARWWFAAINGRIPGVSISTDGRRYVRSGDLVEAWIAEAIFTSSGEVFIGLVNDDPGAIWVYGDERRRQVPGHATTGWPWVHDELDEAQDYVDDLMIDLWDEIVKKALGQ